MPSYMIRISPQAYKGLLNLCEAHNYYNANALVNRGISRLLTACQTNKIKWIDNRPEYARTADETADLFQHARIWNDGSIKIHQCIGANAPIIYLIAIASEHRIRPFAEQRKMLTGTNIRTRLPVSDSPASIAAAVLEAIGLSWLTPATNIPLFQPSNPYSRRSTNLRRLKARLGIVVDRYH